MTFQTPLEISFDITVNFGFHAFSYSFTKLLLPKMSSIIIMYFISAGTFSKSSGIGISSNCVELVNSSGHLLSVSLKCASRFRPRAVLPIPGVPITMTIPYLCNNFSAISFALDLTYNLLGTPSNMAAADPEKITPEKHFHVVPLFLSILL